jgi:hypothetical protein
VVSANGHFVVRLRAEGVPVFVAAETAENKSLVDPNRSQLKLAHLHPNTYTP